MGAASAGEGALDRLVWGASRLGDAATLQQLLARGAGTNWSPPCVVDSEGNLLSPDPGMGMSCLCVAAMEGHQAIISQLLEAGADVNQAREADGATPLFVAAMYKREAIVKMLLEAGADLNLAFPTANPDR